MPAGLFQMLSQSWRNIFWRGGHSPGIKIPELFSSNLIIQLATNQDLEDFGQNLRYNSFYYSKLWYCHLWSQRSSESVSNHNNVQINLNFIWISFLPGYTHLWRVLPNHNYSFSGEAMSSHHWCQSKRVVHLASKTPYTATFSYITVAAAKCSREISFTCALGRNISWPL